MADHDTGYAHVDPQLIVRDLLETLDERDRMVIELRFFENRTQEEIAEQIGVSQSYLSRILRRVRCSTCASSRPGAERPLAGVLDLAKEVLARMKADNVSLLAAAIAFWGMLALVPTLVALVSLYGLVADPAEVERQVRESTQALPAEAQQLIVTQLRAVVDAPSAGLGTGLVIGLAVALLAASAGMRTLIHAIGVVYGDRAGDQGFVTERGKALGLTFGGIAFVAAAVLLVAVFPSDHLLWVIQWALLGVGLVLGIGTLYRLGPAKHPEPRLLSTGGGRRRRPRGRRDHALLALLEQLRQLQRDLRLPRRRRHPAALAPAERHDRAHRRDVEPRPRRRMRGVGRGGFEPP